MICRGRQIEDAKGENSVLESLGFNYFILFKRKLVKSENGIKFATL